MEKTYLFFDVECANCFGGVGKICSFGYVLADSNLNVIESNDIVMNPECEFDWYLFAHKDDIKLSYPQSYFRSQPAFPSFYEQIRDLIRVESRTVIAFSALNDVGFVETACERYKLPLINFSAYDSEKFVKSDEEIFGSLEKRCAILGVDNSDLQAHKSSDDAVMTMRLVQAYCKKINLSIDELLKINRQYCYSTAQFLKRREERAIKKAKRAQRYGKDIGRSRKNDSRTIRFD